MKILKLKIQGTLLLIIFSLFGCTPSKTQHPKPEQQPSPSSVRADTVTCPEKEICNIDNYKQHIYNPGTKCNLSCVKTSGINTTNWAWNNIPSQYSKGCDALKTINLVFTFLVCADLVGLNLSKQNLTDSDLSGANLAYANLQGAVLNNTNMKEANVTGANLDTDLSTTHLTGAIYNQKTKFPENFQPESKRMVKDDYNHSF